MVHREEERAGQNPVYDGYDVTLAFEWTIPREGLDYWRNLKTDGRRPARSDIDPIGLPRHLLPHVFMLDVEARAPRRYCWRLIGTHITTVLKRDSTGRYLDEVLPPHVYSRFVRPLDWVVENGRPARVFGRVGERGTKWLPFEHFVAPLWDARGKIDVLFGIAVYRTT